MKRRYIQLTIPEFFERYPGFAEDLKDSPLYYELLNDPLYLVRVRNGAVEFGYLEDDWLIK